MPFYSSNLFRRAVLLISAALLAALLTAAPVSASTITACQKKRGGSLRVVTSKTKCKRTEKKVRWSQSGPTGKAGKTGKAGTNGVAGGTGVTGARGPSDGWYAFNNETYFNSKAITLALPAGAYALSGSMWAYVAGAATGATVGSVTCTLISPADIYRGGEALFTISGVSGGTNSYGAGVANTMLVLPVASTVTLTCAKSTGATDVVLYQARIQAVQVGQLN